MTGPRPKIKDWLRWHHNDGTPGTMRYYVLDVDFDVDAVFACPVHPDGARDSIPEMFTYARLDDTTLGHWEISQEVTP